MFERLHHQRIEQVLQTLDGERCMQVMDMKMPKALLWQRLRKLQKILPKSTPL